MSRRAVLGTLMGLLLPVPLVLLLCVAAREGLRAQGPEDARISPVLSFEERLNLSTYHRPCKRSEDCEHPLSCLVDPRSGNDYCTDSQCETAEQCPEGFSCRLVRAVKNSPLVRFCIPPGVRQEGEECVSIPVDQDDACAPGLLCSAGWCGRSCRREEPANCPEGFFCGAVTPGPVCLPTCEARTCPEGQRCIRFREGSSACSVVYGTDCQRTPCPEGQKCRTYSVTERPGEVWMACVQFCGEGHRTCPDGLICHQRKCHQPCDPEVSGMCGVGYQCKHCEPDGPWVCQPDWPREQ